MQISPYKRERLIHNAIIGLLRNNPKGLTMSEIVRNTKVSRKAAEKHLQILVLENEIYMKQFGVTKVYYPNNRIHHFDFEHLDYNNRTVWFDILENEYGKYLLIQKKRKLGNEWVHEHSITIPLEQGEQFLKVLEKILHSQRMSKLINKPYQK
jgi:predicted transcriptional regulator